MSEIEIKLDTRKLDKLIGEYKKRAEKILNKSAANIQAQAKIRTVRVDTGAMKNGWATKRTAPLERIVGNVMEYAIHHEYGTSRGISPSPMLRPAVEDERRVLTERWKELCDDV